MSEVPLYRTSKSVPALWKEAVALALAVTTADTEQSN